MQLGDQSLHIGLDHLVEIDDLGINIGDHLSLELVSNVKEDGTTTDHEFPVSEAIAWEIGKQGTNKTQAIRLATWGLKYGLHFFFLATKVTGHDAGMELGRGVPRVRGTRAFYISHHQPPERHLIRIGQGELLKVVSRRSLIAAEGAWQASSAPSR